MNPDKSDRDWLHHRVRFLDELAAVTVVCDWIDERKLDLSEDEIEELIFYARFGPDRPNPPI